MKTFPLPSRPFGSPPKLRAIHYVVQVFNGHTWCTITRPRDTEAECIEIAKTLDADHCRVSLVDY